MLPSKRVVANHFSNQTVISFQEQWVKLHGIGTPVAHFT
jgi:hypothetical protein